MPRETVAHTLKVAISLCIVASVLVATAAVGLRDRQQANREREMRKNILVAAGLFDPEVHGDADVDPLFERVEPKIIDFRTGEYTDAVQVGAYEQADAAKDPLATTTIPSDDDLGNIKQREHYAYVYLVNGEDGRTLEQVVLPIRGYGLWSTLWGFLAIDAQSLKESPDEITISGLTYYEHAETPGLGGEVDNPNWKALWRGKKIYDDDWNVEVEVIKGSVSRDMPGSEYKVDGISGATITARGVTNMLRYWLAEDQFGRFLKDLRDELRKKEGTVAGLTNDEIRITKE